MKYKVVIIDDEPWTREAIKSLADWDKYNMYVAGEASDGNCALSLVNRLKPDIIITDVRMPGMDGLELLSRLREENCNSRTIVISGYDDYSYIRKALKLNVTDYLLKPVKPEVLNEQLERCVEQLNAQIRATDSTDGVNAFMAVEWIGEYTKQRDQLYNCLWTQEKSLIAIQISQLTKTIIQNEPGPISIKLMINIYYDLMHLLEQFIVVNGYTIDDVFQEQNLSYIFCQSIELKNMMDYIASLYTQAANSIEQLIRARNRINTKQIKEYVDANYTDSITLEQVASRFYLSKEYLSKLYKEFTGQSFSCYITDLRMQEAKTLICEYKVPIKDVVTMVGYTDQAHFYKTFRKYFGMTPGFFQRTRL